MIKKEIYNLNYVNIRVILQEFTFYKRVLEFFFFFFSK